MRNYEALPRSLRLSVIIGALIALLVPASVQAAPVISREHFEFPVRVDECGIGTLNVSLDAFNLVNATAPPDASFLAVFATVDKGTAVDPVSGATYQFLDRFTQAAVFRSDQPSVNTAERTFAITGGQGGIVVRAVVHTTVLPDGSVTSDVDVRFLRCL
jgi:hypothetical protein